MQNFIFLIEIIYSVKAKEICFVNLKGLKGGSIRENSWGTCGVFSV